MSWLRKRRIDRKLAKQANGYNLAAGDLLRGATIVEVRSYIETAMAFGEYDDFDSGYEAAINDWEKLAARKHASARIWQTGKND